MWPLLGGLISGGLNLLGGFMGQRNQEQINQENIAAQEQINSQNIAAAQNMNTQNINAQTAMNQQNLADQLAFAQQGIQWKVQDAKDAGINPLAALGAQTASFSNLVAPQATATPSLTAPHAQASNSLGTGVAGMGQDLSRAIAATRSPEEQAAAVEKTRLDLEASQLDNELKRSALASSVTRLASAQIGPGIPKESSGGNELATFRDQDGNPVSGPARGTEGWAWLNPIAKEQYAARNIIEPTLGYNIPKSWGAPSAGKSWYLDPFTGRGYQSPSISQAFSAFWDQVKSASGSSSRRPRISVTPSDSLYGWGEP